jgi:hypothetical protein
MGGRDDPFLTSLPPEHHTKLISLFAAAVRENGAVINGDDPTAKPRKPVGEGSVRAALDAVASTFRSNGLPSPIHEPSGRLLYVLGRQLKGYKNNDPGSKPQKALPPSVIREVATITNTPLDLAIAQLVVGAFFFAMRSCEYSTVSGERRTKLLQVSNIRFFKNKKEVPHSSPHLHLADCVSITFTFQKNEHRDETITMHRTLDPTLCPVRSWAAIITRLWSYDDTTTSTTVNTFQHKGKTLRVKASQILTTLRTVVSTMGADTLGFTAKEIGTHSIRSSSAMAMYLASVPVYTIMLIGRWSSDAFLRYIRRQVQEFSSGVAARMIISSDYFTIPDVASREDPRASQQHLNFAPRNQTGLGAQTFTAPTAMALWH